MRKEIQDEYNIIRNYNMAINSKKYIKALYYKIVIKIKGYEKW